MKIQNITHIDSSNENVSLKLVDGHFSNIIVNEKVFESLDEFMSFVQEVNQIVDYLSEHPEIK